MTRRCSRAVLVATLAALSVVLVTSPADAPVLVSCPWDVDGDGSVTVADLAILLCAWGTNPGGPPDFNGDGSVDVDDEFELLANWGPCP